MIDMIRQMTINSMQWHKIWWGPNYQPSSSENLYGRFNFFDICQVLNIIALEIQLHRRLFPSQLLSPFILLFLADVFSCTMAFKSISTFSFIGDWFPINWFPFHTALSHYCFLLHIDMMFDFSLWHLSAATCCYHLKNHRIIKKHGTHAVLAIALFMFSFATLVIMVRISYAVNEDEENEWEDVLKVETFFVVLGYMLQLSVVYFIFSPVLVTILFSGCLGCIPGMGGRPKDIQREINSMIQFQTKCNYRRDYSDTSENEYHFV